MQYPVMNRGREYRVSVPQLNGGVNLSVPPHQINDNQLSAAENMWFRNGVLQTRPRLVGSSNGTFNEKEYFRGGAIGPYGYILHDGNGYASIVKNNGTFLWVATLGAGTLMPAALGGKFSDRCAERSMLLYHRSAAVNDNSGVYILGKDADHPYWAKDENENPIEGRPEKLTPYVPTVLINGRPQATLFGTAVGDQLEPYNMLTDEYICKFTPDGENPYFILPDPEDDIVGITICTSAGEEPHVNFNENGVETKKYASGYSAVYKKNAGCFWFYENEPSGNATLGDPDPDLAVAIPKGSENSVVVIMKRKSEKWLTSRNTILNMGFSAWFGGETEGLSGGTRLFVSGNPEKPNLVHWSALNDPTYFPENNYAYVGDATGAVTAFGKQSNMLVIFKEKEVFCTTYNRGAAVTAEDIETQRVVDIEAAAAVFPIIPLHSEIGCDCPGTIQLCNNRLVWLNSDGRVYGLFSAGAFSERNLRELSLQIENKLRSYSVEQRRAATATCYDDHYILLVGGEMLVMDFSSYGFTYYGSYSSDEKAQKNVVWHYWKTATKLDTAVTIGDQAVFMGLQEYHDGTDEDTVNDHYLSLYKLGVDETCSDAKFELNGSDRAFTYTPFTSRFTTKLYDFDRPERLKRVNSMYLQVSGTAGKTVFLGYHDGKRSYVNRDLLMMTGDSPEAAAPFRVTPNMLRVRQFGLSVTSDAHIKVGGIVLNYSMMGAMR